MCYDNLALPILTQFADAAAGGAEPLRRPRVGRLDIAAKKLRALERREVVAWTRHADHLVPASDRTRPSRFPRALSLLRLKRSFATLGVVSDLQSSSPRMSGRPDE